MDNVIENSLNFWQQRLNLPDSSILPQSRDGTIVDKVVLSSAQYWKKLANDFLGVDSCTNSLIENCSS